MPQRVKIHVSLTRDTYLLLLSSLGEYTKGDISRTVEEAIIYYLHRPEARREPVEAGAGGEEDVGETIIRQLENEGVQQVAKYEIEELAAKAGVISAKARAALIRRMIMSRKLVPVMVRQNKIVFRVVGNGRG